MSLPFGDALGGVLEADLDGVFAAAFGEVLEAALGEAVTTLGEASSLSSLTGAERRLSWPMLFFRDFADPLGFLGLSTFGFYNVK